MYLKNKHAKRTFFAILFFAIATYLLTGMSILISFKFIQIPHSPVNMILFSIGTLIMGLVGVLVLFGSVCENKHIRGDLVPVYWMLYSLLSGLALFLAISELIYVLNTPDPRNVLLLPMSILILVTTLVTTVFSYVIHFYFKVPFLNIEQGKPPTYNDVIEKRISTPPPKYSEVS